MTTNPTQRAIDTFIRYTSPDLHMICFALAIFDIAMIELGDLTYLSSDQTHFLKLRDILSSYLEVLDHD